MNAEELLTADIAQVSDEVAKLQDDYCELTVKHDALAEDCKWLRVELDRVTRLNNEQDFWIFAPYVVAIIAAATYGLAAVVKWFS